MPIFVSRAARKPKYVEPSAIHREIAATKRIRDAMLIDTLWHTGGRLSEVLAIRKGHRREHGIWLRNLKQHDKQADKVVAVLDAAFMERLAAYAEPLAPNDYLFPGRFPGTHMTRQRAWQIIKKAALEAGVLLQHAGDAPLVAMWPHSLRHSHAVHLLSSGVPLNAVSSQLGHSNVATTSVYLDISDPDRERLIAAVNF